MKRWMMTLNSPVVIAHLFDSAQNDYAVLDKKATISEEDLEELKSLSFHMAQKFSVWKETAQQQKHARGLRQKW